MTAEQTLGETFLSVLAALFLGAHYKLLYSIFVENILSLVVFDICEIR